MAKEHTFKAIRDEEGELMKMKGSLSNYKDLTVNCFNDKPYAHLSDVGKCFKKGGGFDLNKVKSVTLNREEVDAFIQMSRKLLAIMDKMSPKSDPADRDASETPKKKAQKATTKRKIIPKSDDSDSDTGKPSAKSKTSSLKQKKKRSQPYKKPYQQKRNSQKESDTSDTDLLSD